MAKKVRPSLDEFKNLRKSKNIDWKEYFESKSEDEIFCVDDIVSEMLKLGSTVTNERAMMRANKYVRKGVLERGIDKFGVRWYKIK